MARLPNGCSRMLCALLQFGSVVSAVNRPSPATARTRRSGPRTALSKRFSSLSSSTRSWPETITIGEPIMSSQKIGPNSFASRARFCTGAVESSDSMLPTTGLVGGCGIGLSRLVEAIAGYLPVVLPYAPRHPEVRALARLEGRTAGTFIASILRGSPKGLAPQDDAVFASPKFPPAPLDQLVADLLGFFLLGPVAAALHQIFLEVGNDLFHAVGGRRHGKDHSRPREISGEGQRPLDPAGKTR